MKRYTLNLSTRYNVFLGRYLLHFSYGFTYEIVPSIAREDFHTLFDRGKWLLLPEDRILDVFLGSLSTSLVTGRLYADRKKFPTFENVHFFISCPNFEFLNG